MSARPRTALLLAAAALVGATLASGCGHAPQFRRIGDPPKISETPGPGTARVAVALTGTRRYMHVKKQRGGAEDPRIAAGVEDALRAAGAEVGAASADYEIDVMTTTTGRSSGVNFLISWPGFIVFAPAWHGFVWKYDVKATARIRDLTGRELAPVTVKVPYEVRYTPAWQGVLSGFGFTLYTIPAIANGLLTSTIRPNLKVLDRALPAKECRAVGVEVGRAVARVLAKDGPNLAAARAAAKASGKKAPEKPQSAVMLVAAPKKPTAKSGMIKVFTNPPYARVFVDDLYVGDTPVECNPKPGKHRVVISMPGFESIFAEVELGAESVEIERKLKALGGAPRR